MYLLMINETVVDRKINIADLQLPEGQPEFYAVFEDDGHQIKEVYSVEHITLKKDDARRI